jgi:hypothetical protein
MKKKLLIIASIIGLLIIMFLTNPSLQTFHESLSKSLNINPRINYFLTQTDIEKEQGLKNNIINYQTAYMDFKLFSIGVFKSSFTASNFENEPILQSINQEYDNKILSIGIFGHVFVFSGLNDLLLEYYFDVDNYIKIPSTNNLPASTSGKNTFQNFWENYYDNNKQGLTIGAKYKGGNVLYLLREGDNINLNIDSTHSIKYNKDTVHGILIKKVNDNEAENVRSSFYTPKKVINWNQFKIGNAIKNNIEFYNKNSIDNWVVPTLDELYLIYFAKNRLSGINFDGVSPSSSLTLAPGISNTSYGLWLKNLNNNENYFDPLFERKNQILVKYF